MSSDEDFDDTARREYEDQLYHDESTSGSEDELDSEVEEALYSQVHYASSLLVSQNSSLGDQETPSKENLQNNDLPTKGQHKFHTNPSVIEISSDDNEHDKDKCHNADGDVNIDSVEEVEVCSKVIKYPEVIEISSDDNTSIRVGRNTEMAALRENEKELGEIIEKWDLNERDLEDSSAKQRPRYYTVAAAPGKGNPHMRCYNCNEKGHLSESCPQPKKIKVCFLCGDSGHIRRNCPNDLCFNCKERGHISKQCTKRRVRPFDRCKRCHILGHFADDCPDLWRQYHLTTEVGPIVCPDRPPSPSQSVYCYNCGRQGHYGHECPENYLCRKGQPPLPFVVRYDVHPASTSHIEENEFSREERPRCSDFLERETDGSLFEPPPGKNLKNLKLNDGDDLRRDGGSYQTKEYNATHNDHILPKKKKKNKKRRKKEKPLESNERTVEFIDPSLPDEGLIEEPHYKKSKTRTVEFIDPSLADEELIEEPHSKRSKKRQRGQREEAFGNSYNYKFHVRECEHDNGGYSNAHRTRNDFRSFEDGNFHTSRTSYNPRESREDNFSNRGFRFLDQKHNRENSNVHHTREDLSSSDDRDFDARRTFYNPREGREDNISIRGFSFLEQKHNRENASVHHTREDLSSSDDRDFDARRTFYNPREGREDNISNRGVRFKDQRDNRGYANAHHTREDFRSFEDTDVDTRKTSHKRKKRRKDFISRKGFRFKGQTNGNKSHPHFFKPYTF